MAFQAALFERNILLTSTLRLRVASKIEYTIRMRLRVICTYVADYADTEMGIPSIIKGGKVGISVIPGGQVSHFP
jgi:hypothetical protein